MQIRRGEDWRRSGHNRACQMNDQPYHHTPDHYISLAQHTAKHFEQPQLVWGHDHDGAYRQLPLQDPETAYMSYYRPRTDQHCGTTTSYSSDQQPVSGHTIDSEMYSPTSLDAFVEYRLSTTSTITGVSTQNKTHRAVSTPLPNGTRSSGST